MKYNVSTPYFAYGSNIDVPTMTQRCPGVSFVGAAKLNGYRFIINTHGYATITPQMDASVYGILWEIMPDDEKKLDIVEEVADHLYIKMDAHVHLIGKRTQHAMTYIAPNMEPGMPRDGYMKRIVDAAEQHGFPSYYTKSLGRWASQG